MSEPPVRFERYRNKAKSLVKSPAEIQRLLGQVSEKMAQASSHRWQSLLDQVGIALALVRAWASGDYQGVSNKTIVVLVAALLYFVVPLDVVPDFLFGWGLLDDAAVLGYVLNQVSEEIDAFEHWRKHDVASLDDREDGGES